MTQHCLLLSLLLATLCAAVAAAPLAPGPVAYHDGALHVDYPALVGHNDVVYLTPAIYPYEALPLGNGNLGVTLWNAGGMYYKFNNGSFFRPGPEGETMPCSSGEALLSCTPSFVDNPTDFTQRLSLYDGAVYTRVTTPQGEVQVTSFTAEGQDLLVVHVVDHRTGPISGKLTLSHWRDDVQFSGENGVIAMTSASGLPGSTPSLTGLPTPTTSVLAACAEGMDATAGPVAGKSVSLNLSASGPAEYTIYFAAPAVRTDQGDALAYARTRLQHARESGWQALLAEHQRYWADFWSKSALYLRSGDATAEYYTQLWYLNLYWAACQSRGPYCPKFNGGNFLLHQDQRFWGGRYWWQNTREMFWCLPAANHAELVQPLFDLYYSLLPADHQHARDLFHVGGIQIEETIDQNGSYNGSPWVRLILTNGLETAFHFYEWSQYTGNEKLLREKVYPYMKEAVQFFLEYAKRGTDGKWHLYPANSRETWWRVQDDAPDLYGLHACIPILLRESQRLGRDADLRPVWQEFLDHLADYPTDPATGAYLPCRYVPEAPASGLPAIEELYHDGNVSHNANEIKNCETPECELIYPWNLAGIDSANYAQTLRTFNARKWSGTGWDPSGVWAARLGLADAALNCLAVHGQGQRWPQGWWNNVSASGWNAALVDEPYFDPPGVNATTLTEMCLQSYDGRIRLWPACPGKWTGLMRLRALPGFMVTSEIAAGHVRYAVIESERGEVCRLVNPWEGELRVTGPGGFRLESGEREVSFATKPGGRYLVESVAAPLSGAPYAELKPAINEGPRWPGQTSPDQPWRPGQLILLGLAKNGGPLRLLPQTTPAE